jgi:putative effector of murein hydrolase
MKSVLAPYSKAIAAFLGAAVVVLAVPLAQGDLPSQGDWKHALAAALGGVVAVYFAPKNAE